jgi:hypothetical protein
MKRDSAEKARTEMMPSRTSAKPELCVSCLVSTACNFGRLTRLGIATVASAHALINEDMVTHGSFETAQTPANAELGCQW